MQFIIINVVIQDSIPCNNLYFSKFLNFTLALEANENICISIIRELKDNTNEVKSSLLFNEMFNRFISFIPLDISNIPVIIAVITLDVFKLLNIMEGISENITVYENIKASVFSVPRILVYNSSKGADILLKVFEFVSVCCIILVLYEGVISIPIIIAAR